VVQCGAVWCSVVQCGAVWCSVVQCVAVCCSVLQCDAVWCSVVQCGEDPLDAAQVRYTQTYTYTHKQSHISTLCVNIFCHMKGSQIVIENIFLMPQLLTVLDDLHTLYDV